MEIRLSGRVQSGKGDASHWLSKFNAAYSQKVGASIFPGSLNIALASPFDWFASDVVRRTITFDRDEYGGERDILLVPCVLWNLACQGAWLWTPTTAARSRPDPWVVEIIAATSLRESFGLVDGSIVEIQLPEDADS
jgi:CTP-dependent riboflavin kinase